MTHLDQVIIDKIANSVEKIYFKYLYTILQGVQMTFENLEFILKDLKSP